MYKVCSSWSTLTHPHSIPLRSVDMWVALFHAFAQFCRQNCYSHLEEQPSSSERLWMYTSVVGDSLAWTFTHGYNGIGRQWTERDSRQPLVTNPWKKEVTVSLHQVYIKMKQKFGTGNDTLTYCLRNFMAISKTLLIL